MYRRYYKETPPGYSGVAFAKEREEDTLPKGDAAAEVIHGEAESPKEEAFGQEMAEGKECATATEEMAEGKECATATEEMAEGKECATATEAVAEGETARNGEEDCSEERFSEAKEPQARSLGMKAEKEGIDWCGETAVPPCRYSCTEPRRASGAEKKAPQGEAFAEASGEDAASAAAPSKKGLPLFKKSFTLEDVLLAVVALMLISGELEEETLLLLGLVLVLLGK